MAKHFDSELKNISSYQIIYNYGSGVKNTYVQSSNF